MGRRWLLIVPVPLLLAATLNLSSAGTTAVATAAVSHAPRLPGKPWVGPEPTTPASPGSFSPHVVPTHAAMQDPNWSGYAVTGTAYHSVVGSWHVPSVLTPPTRKLAKKNLYSATWTGIDGFSNQNLIQAGTEEDWLHGTRFYYAWWEILPAPETPISSAIVAVHPGDGITVSITKGFSKWTIQLTDTTTGRTFTTVQSYSGQMASAEWIQEAVTVGRRLSKLPHDTTVDFDRGMVNGASVVLEPFEALAIAQKGVQVSTPSAPDSDHDGFAVAYGSAVPRAPAS